MTNKNDTKIEMFHQDDTTDTTFNQHLLNFLNYQKSYLAIKDVDSLLVNNDEDEDNVDNDNENIKEKVHEITNPTDIQTRNYKELYNAFNKGLSLDVLIKLDLDYIVCHSSILSTCNAFANFFKNDAIRQIIKLPDRPEIEFYLVDLTEKESRLKSTAVNAVINLLYTGELSYRREDKNYVFAAVKKFENERGILRDVYDESLKD